MGQMVLNKDSNEVKRFIEAMEGISKILDANSLIYRPILDGHRYITEQELSKALKITKRTLIEYRMNGKLPYYKIGGKILYKEQDIIEILERNNISLHADMMCDATEIRVEAVKRNMGIAYVIKEAVKNELVKKELYEVELPIDLPSIKLNLVYLSGELSKIDKKFIKEYLKK